MKREGFIPTLATWRKLVSAAALPGSSRFQLEHEVEFSTPAPERAKSPTSWASCSIARPGAASCFPYCAERAAACVDNIHRAVWESCSLTDELVTLLWLNPLPTITGRITGGFRSIRCAPCGCGLPSGWRGPGSGARPRRIRPAARGSQRKVHLW